MMKKVGFSVALAVLALSSAWSQVKITCNVKDGDVLTGDVVVRAAVESKALITSVEFYVGGDLRSTDDSTPYELGIDTIVEKEGPIEIKVSAFSNDGKSASQTLKLKIDNQVEKGAAFHVEKGRDALVASKFADAVTSGRIALKADANSIPAKLLLARAYFSLGTFDQAQKFSEDVLAVEPNNSEALDLNAAIALERAFAVNSGDRNESVAAIGKALKTAASNRNRVYEQQLASFGEVNEENRLKWLDLNLRAGRYSRVINDSEPIFNADPKNSSIANRYVYALIKGGRPIQANNALTVMFRRGAPDAISYALNAIMLQRAGKEQESLDMEKQAILNDGSDLTVQSAQIFLAMQRGRIAAMNDLVKALAKTEGHRYEVMNFQSTVFGAMSEFELSRQYFEEAVLNEPTAHNTYVQRANQLIGYSTNPGTSKDDAEYERKLARAFFDAALDARPESFEALTGLAMLSVLEGDVTSGVRLAEAANKAGREYAASRYLLVLAYSLKATEFNRAAEAAIMASKDAEDNGLRDEAQKQRRAALDLSSLAKNFENLRSQNLRQAQQFDPYALEGVGTPTVLDFWKYFAGAARTPLLIPPQY